MESPLVNATKYLEARQLSLAHITSAVQNIMPWEALIFGGSIPEGLANADADIDLMLIGGVRPHDSPAVMEGDAEVSFRMALAPLKVQLESVRSGHLELLAKFMQETSEALERPEKAHHLRSFGLADLRILHRLRTGIRLINPEVTEHWAKLLHLDLLPRYMLVLMVVQHFSLREDAIGEARLGRRESSLWFIREFLSRAAGALLASIGESHSYDKWRVRLIQLHEEKIGNRLAEVLVRNLTTPQFEELGAFLRSMIDLSDEVIETAVMGCPEVLPILMTLRNEQFPLTTHVSAQ